MCQHLRIQERLFAKEQEELKTIDRWYLLREGMSHLAEESKVMRFLFDIEGMADFFVLLAEFEWPHSHLLAKVFSRLDHRNNIHSDTLDNVENGDASR